MAPCIKGKTSEMQKKKYFSYYVLLQGKSYYLNEKSL